MAKCSPANETGGFCWRSAVWKFDGAFAAVEASSSTPSGKRPASSSSSSTPSGKRPDSQNESEDTCSICEDAIADTVVLPCMHKCVCQSAHCDWKSVTLQTSTRPLHTVQADHRTNLVKCKVNTSCRNRFTYE